MSREEYRTEGLLYESARLSLLELRMIGAERMERLLGSGSMETCLRYLTEYGVVLYRDKESGAFLREETLEARLKEVYGELFSAVGQPLFLKLWLYPYDCQNIKAAIKCRQRGIDPREMLFDCGILEIETVLQAVQSHDYSALPPLFAAAAEEASQAFAASGNPQTVDFILDRACYRAMAEDAQASGVPIAMELVRRKIDLTNLMTAVRLVRMRGNGSVSGLLKEALLEGGEIPLEDLLLWCGSGEVTLWRELRRGNLEKFAMAAGGEEASLSQIERAADNCMIGAVREAKRAVYGAETLIGYLLGSEYEVRNLRILLAGMELFHSAEAIRERIRDCYV